MGITPHFDQTAWPFQVILMFFTIFSILGAPLAWRIGSGIAFPYSHSIPHVLALQDLAKAYRERPSMTIFFPSLWWSPFLCPPCLCFSKTCFFCPPASRRGLFFAKTLILKKLNKFLFHFYIVFAYVFQKLVFLPYTFYPFSIER